MILSMYITMLPVILGGILHMIYTKTPMYAFFYSPIDCRLVLKDGRRLFGTNKTWEGLVFMPFITMLVQLLWGRICILYDLSGMNALYNVYGNTADVNLYAGFCFGLAYILFELPNSFIKRRLGIPEGKTVSGVKGGIFLAADQLDSMLGVMLVLYIVSDISVFQYFIYVLLGGFTHLGVNVILYKLGVRRNL